MLTVSNYHYIREDFRTDYPSIFGVTPAQFRHQLELLKGKGDFIHPADLTANADAILNAPEHYFLVTFDDGLKEQYDHAVPILDALEIPALFFPNSRNFEDQKVSTVHKIHLLRSVLAPKDLLEKLNNTADLSANDRQKAALIYKYDDATSASLKYLLNYKMAFDRQEADIEKLFVRYFEENEVLESLYMTRKNAIELAQKGCLGSHTHNHFPLGLLAPEAMRFELAHSKSYFEALTDCPIDTVAYPYGTPEACTETVAEIAKDAGYQIGFTFVNGTNDGSQNPLLLQRFDCNDLPGGKNYTHNTLPNGL